MASEPAPLARRLLSSSVDATEALGAELGRRAGANLVVALDGDLGAGKTAFVRGLARGLGADPAEVASPTYTLMHALEGRLALYHFDAWMQGREQTFLEDGGAEWFSAGGVAAIEWAERVAEHLPEARVHVRLGHWSPSERTIEMGARGARERALVLALVLPAGVRELTEAAGGHRSAGAGPEGP